jgi:hypothetical protein
VYNAYKEFYSILTEALELIKNERDWKRSQEDFLSFEIATTNKFLEILETREGLQTDKDYLRILILNRFDGWPIYTDFLFRK